LHPTPAEGPNLAAHVLLLCRLRRSKLNEQELCSVVVRVREGCSEENQDKELLFSDNCREGAGLVVNDHGDLHSSSPSSTSQKCSRTSTALNAARGSRRKCMSMHMLQYFL
jgi:hypothetical protein